METEKINPKDLQKTLQEVDKIRTAQELNEYISKADARKRVILRSSELRGRLAFKLREVGQGASEEVLSETRKAIEKLLSQVEEREGGPGSPEKDEAPMPGPFKPIEDEKNDETFMDHNEQIEYLEKMMENADVAAGLLLMYKEIARSMEADGGAEIPLIGQTQALARILNDKHILAQNVRRILVEISPGNAHTFFQRELQPAERSQEARALFFLTRIVDKHQEDIAVLTQKKSEDLTMEDAVAYLRHLSRPATALFNETYWWGKGLEEKDATTLFTHIRNAQEELRIPFEEDAMLVRSLPELDTRLGGKQRDFLSFCKHACHKTSLTGILAADHSSIDIRDRKPEHAIFVAALNTLHKKINGEFRPYLRKYGYNHLYMHNDRRTNLSEKIDEALEKGLTVPDGLALYATLLRIRDVNTGKLPENIKDTKDTITLLQLQFAIAEITAQHNAAAGNDFKKILFSRNVGSVHNPDEYTTIDLPEKVVNILHRYLTIAEKTGIEEEAKDYLNWGRKLFDEFWTLFRSQHPGLQIGEEIATGAATLETLRRAIRRRRNFAFLRLLNDAKVDTPAGRASRRKLARQWGFQVSTVESIVGNTVFWERYVNGPYRKKSGALSHIEATRYIRDRFALLRDVKKGLLLVLTSAGDGTYKSLDSGTIVDAVAEQRVELERGRNPRVIGSGLTNQAIASFYRAEDFEHIGNNQYRLRRR